MMTAKDAPACLLPNGRVLILAGPAGAGGWSSASRFFEFDGTSIVRVADAANAGGVTYIGRMMLVPSGEVLFTDGSSTVAVYTPDAGYDSAWQPVITSCPTDVQLGQTFTLTGRQLNGLSQASVYGDDVQNSTNYPIVRARNTLTGAVSYWRTANHSTMGIGTGTIEVSTTFTVPSTIDQGTYELVVIANGIPCSGRTRVAPGTVRTCRTRTSPASPRTSSRPTASTPTGRAPSSQSPAAGRTSNSLDSATLSSRPSKEHRHG
jgi:hypothetical protein